MCAKTKGFSKEKGGFLLQDSLILLRQAVVAARLVGYFRSRIQPAPACARAVSATAAVALVTSSAPDPAAALAPDPGFCENHRDVANDDIGIHTGNPEAVQSSTLEQSKLATGTLGPKQALNPKRVLSVQIPANMTCRNHVPIHTQAAIDNDNDDCFMSCFYSHEKLIKRARGYPLVTARRAPWKCPKRSAL